MQKFEYLIKNNQKITLRIFQIPEVSNSYYQIWAYSKENASIGYLAFEILRKQHQADLRGINVCTKYLGKGVGSTMNGLFEQFALQNGCDEIKGVYFPQGEGAELTPAFYARNHYHIFVDDDDFSLSLLKKTITKTDYAVPQLIESETIDTIPTASWSQYR